MKRQLQQRNANLTSVQFHQIARSFAIRYITFLREKSHPPQLLEQLEILLSKILTQNQSNQVILNKLLSLQLKGDYHQVIALTLLQDLAKWSRQNYENLSCIKSQQYLLNQIIDQSIKLLNSQQQFHTIVPKQNDLLRQLLIMPYLVQCRNTISIENFRTFYRKLKDVKEFYPQIVKENQKILFLKTVQEVIQTCARLEATKTLEFVFGNVFAELEALEETHQFVTSRLKLLKKIVKNIWFFHDDIMYKTAFIIMKFSHKVLALPHLFSSLLNLYEDLMPRLIKKRSPAPLIIFNHLILNNIKKIIQDNQSSHYFCLQIFLNSLSQIFTEPFIEYFMKYYDANFMEESICQGSLNILFEFVENRLNQKKYDYQIFKKYLKKATDNIRTYLNSIQPTITQPPQKLLKFYQVKKKQYLQIVQDMNQKPKKIFKKLQSISNKQIRQEIIKKYVRIAKKSIHLENKKMIDIFATNNSVSEELFAEYVDLLFSNLSKDVNLEEFLRYFSSNFFLNGQSQQILRVLDTITVLFYDHQPHQSKVMKNSDSTYTFANAIILLNTDLHNPQNEQKMSLQSFYKMCKRINNGQDLPIQILNTTYSSIKKNKINTFRNKSSMFGISASNFVLICNKQQQNLLQFYDLQMRMLQDQNFYRFWTYDLLVGIIDQRQTMKLQQLIERFLYDDNSYECEVVELIRKLTKKKPYIPLHALEKILQHANFKNVKTSQKSISYLWLCTNIIQSFSSYLPTNVICQILILTWRLRSQIKDDMYLRQKAQIRRIKKMIKQYQKRQSKKSIMDMFSSFLTYKEDVSEDQVTEEFNMSLTNIKKMNHKILTEKIFEVLLKSNSINSKSKINHRAKAIQFFIGYLRNDQQKIFEEFLSLEYLIFHLLYRFDLNYKSQPQVSDSDSPLQTNNNSTKLYSPSKKSSHSSSLHLSTQIHQDPNNSPSQFQQTIQDLFYQLLGLKQSSITKRIQNLRKKDNKKYQVLQSYSQYWVMKILISKISLDDKKSGKMFQLENGQECSVKSRQNIDSVIVGKNNDKRVSSFSNNNNLIYLLHKSIEYLQRTDRQIFLDLIYQFEQKSKYVFKVSLGGSEKDIKIQNENAQRNLKVQEQNAKVEISKESINLIRDNSLKSSQDKIETQKKVLIQQSTTNRDKQSQKQITKQQKQSSLQQINVMQKLASKQKMSQIKDEQQQLTGQLLIQKFIISYKRVIMQFFVNCQRLIGKQQMKKHKQWKWLIQLEKMIKQVMQTYQQRESIKEEKRINQNEVNKNDLMKQIVIQEGNKQNQQVSCIMNNEKQINHINGNQEKFHQQNKNVNKQIDEINRINNNGDKKQDVQEIRSQNLLNQSKSLLTKQINNSIINDTNAIKIDTVVNKINQNSQKNVQCINTIQQHQDENRNNNMEQVVRLQDIQSKIHAKQISHQNLSNQGPQKAQINGEARQEHQQKQRQIQKQNQLSKLSQQKLNLLQMMKQQQQQLKKLQQMYAEHGQNSPQVLGMPFYIV